MAIQSFNAGADLTGKRGYAVMTSGTNKEVILATANADAFGILTNDGIQNEAVPVAMVGEYVKAKLGGSVVFGDPLKVTTGGVLIKAGGTSDDNVIAVAAQDGSANDLIYVTVAKFVK